jgi:carboxymethylenebutenolidase
MRIDLPSGTPAELALPAEQATRGLVLAPDIAGLRPLFDDMAARLAGDHGWAVIAPEPYPGQEDVPVEQRISAPLDVPRVQRDLLEAAEEIARRADVSRVGVLGFCMGGMSTFRAAGTGRFDRAVSFYGMIRPPEHWASVGNDPLDALASPDCCPVLAVLGGVDRWTPPADIDALRNAGPHVTIQVYDDADHGFVHDASRPSHRAQDAADAWHWAVDFLA